jgi:integrase
LQPAEQRDGEPTIVEVIGISPELAAQGERMRAISGSDPVGPVFPSARGGAYNERAFKTAWSRLMAAARNAEQGPPVIGHRQRFTFHDLRAYFVTEHKRLRVELPDLHKDKSTTARVYDRSREVNRRSL